MNETAGNLPSEISTFVGRRRELVLGKELLGTGRLLTLTGTGGIGKTRLAQRLAADSTRAFPDGVWLVELADVQHGRFVAATIAATLGLHSQSADPMTQLTQHLADRTALLVLDNCEHVVDDCASVVADLLAAAPRVRVLATSRQVLGVAGEQVYPVPPMSVSPFDGAAAAGADADSVALFVQRGRAANPGFEVSAANAETVSQICRRLEGVPLAIELAAVRLRTLTEEQILARLDRTLDLLVVGPRSMPERQQRIEATIEWSYRLCTPAERRLWRGLSIFAGGVTLDGLEALGAEEGLAPHVMLAALDGLVEKSILTRSTADGPPRFHLLEVLRQFGHRQLEEAGELTVAHDAHLRFYARIAARGARAYCSPDDYDWMEEVRREQPNLRVAMDHALTTADRIPEAIALAVGLKPYWTHTGFLQEGHAWLGRAVEAAESATPPVDALDRLTALSAHADLGLLLARTAPALEELRACRELAESLGDRLTPLLRAQLGFVETMAAFFSSGPASAIPVGDTAIGLGRAVEATDPGVPGQTLAIVSICAFLADSPDAEQRARDYLAMTEAHGARLLRAVAVWVLSLCHWRAGDLIAAESEAVEALEGFDRFDSQGLLSSAVESLGWTAAQAGDDERAAVIFGFVDKVRRVAQLQIASSITEHAGTAVRADVRRRMGERPWQEAVRRGAALSRSEGVDLARRRSPAPAPTQARATTERTEANPALTKRESEVAALLAEGLSNKDIAQRLVISVRTAEAHVEHILVKLNLTSRAQVAAWIRTTRS